jgi:hypothetical protein
MSGYNYTVTTHEVIYRVYEVKADSQDDAINKIENGEADIHELVGQGSYDCDYAFTGA